MHRVARGFTVFCLLDAEGTVRYLSPSLAKRYPLTDGVSVQDAMTAAMHPDDRVQTLVVWEHLLAEPGHDIEYTFRVTDDNGSLRIIEAVATNLLGDPAVAAIVMVFRDITEQHAVDEALRASEARLRAVTENTTDGLLAVDATGIITWANRAAADLTGHDEGSGIGRSLLDYIHPDDLDVAATALERMVDGSNFGRPMIVRACHADGTWRWVEAITRAPGADSDTADTPVTTDAVFSLRDVTERVAAETALRDSEVRFRTVMQHSYDVVAVVGADATIKWVTPNAERMLGWTPEEATGKNALDLVHVDDQAIMVEELLAFTSGRGVPSPTTVRLRHKDNTWHHVELVGTDFLDNPDVEGIALSLRAVDDRVAAERDGARLREVFEMTDDLVITTTVDGKPIYLNQAARRFFSLPVGSDPEMFDLGDHLTADAASRLRTDAVQALHDADRWTGELDLVRADQTIVPTQAQILSHRNIHHRVEFLSVIIRDISERKAFELQLTHAATHDALTGLPNRTLLLDRLEVALQRATRHGTGVAVLFCDLDHFKVVNDSRGHSHGDRLLVEVADRLHLQLRPGDTVARHGGDEFVILCEDLVDRHDAQIVAARVVDAFNESFTLDDEDVFIGMSVGIAVSSDGEGEADALIRDADAAMYAAKGRGRNQAQFYESGMWEQAVDRLDLDHALRRALGRGELKLHYQPIMRLADNRIIGFEALLRWVHPDRGWLSPLEFITVAEDTGLIIPIGSWVLREACTQLAAWDAAMPAGVEPVTMAVNLSGRQLDRPGFADTVAAALVATGISAGRLHLEVTESVLMRDVDASDALLRRLRRLGVRIAVDDFGTGYSSLAYLRQFPVDALKVDRSFVDGLGTDAGDSAIVAAVVNLAHTLGLVAIAEGVENQTQLDALRELGCDSAQGFLLSQPVEAHEAFFLFDHFSLAANIAAAAAARDAATSTDLGVGSHDGAIATTR